MPEIRPNDRIDYADLIHIVFNNQCIEKIVDQQEASGVTFQDVMQLAKDNGYIGGVILLIAESPFEGKIYQYGNYGNFWVDHGTTKGYA